MTQHSPCLTADPALAPACALTPLPRRQVIELARNIRERRNKSLKMPVRELVVVHTDAAFLGDLTGAVGWFGWVL